MRRKSITDEVRSFERRSLKLEHDKQKFLTSHGWRQSSAFPDCCWRWCKHINDNIVTVPFLNIDEAIGLELASFLSNRSKNGHEMPVSEVATEQ